MRLQIEALGRPAPQGSKERGPAGQLLESSIHLPAWRAAVKNAAYVAYKAAGIVPASLPLFGPGTPVYIERCTFYVGPDQCCADGTLAPLGTPDIDKLLRAVLDALGGARRGTGRVYADDSQIVTINQLSKQRAGHPDRTGALIIVSDGRS